MQYFGFFSSYVAERKRVSRIVFYSTTLISLIIFLVVIAVGAYLSFPNIDKGYKTVWKNTLMKFGTVIALTLLASSCTFLICCLSQSICVLVVTDKHEKIATGNRISVPETNVISSKIIQNTQFATEEKQKFCISN